MAIHKRSDLCKQLNISQAYLKVNIDRGKIVLNKDGDIDDSDPFNIEFINKQIDKKNVVQKEPPPKASKKSTKETLSKYELETRKKQLEVDKLDVEVKIKLIQESKLKGEMLPAPMVKDIFAQHTKHLVSEFQNTMDKVLTRVTQLTKLDNSQVSEFREMITNEINQAQEKAVEISKKAVKNLIQDMTE
jgi:hypothetical protein